MNFGDPATDQETDSGLQKAQLMVQAQGKTYVQSNAFEALANPGGNGGKKRAAAAAWMVTKVGAAQDNCDEVTIIAHGNQAAQLNFIFTDHSQVLIPMADVYAALEPIATVLRINFLCCFCPGGFLNPGKLGICYNGIITPGCHNNQHGWYKLPMINPFVMPGSLAFYMANYNPIFNIINRNVNNCTKAELGVDKYMTVIVAAGGAQAGATTVNFFDYTGANIGADQAIFTG
jgi:hypothetical protein